MSILTRISSFVLLTIFVSLPTMSIAGESKMQALTEHGASASVLKSLDADNKKLGESFKQLMIKEGYIKPDALDCKTTCTVTCTWVNGVCQATTSCSVTCG